MTAQMLHQVLEHFGFSDPKNRELLIMILRALQRQDAETLANYSEVLREIQKMSETLQQQHDNILALVKETNTNVATIAQNMPILSKAIADLEEWFANNSGVNNLVDFSDVEAAINSAKAASDAVNTSVQNIIAANPDPGAPPVSPDFTLAIAPATLSIAQGATGTASLSSTAVGAFTDAVTVTPGALPAGVTLDAASYTLPAGGTAAFTVTVDPTAATPGSYEITFTGTDGSLSHTASLALTVETAAAATS